MQPQDPNVPAMGDEEAKARLVKVCLKGNKSLICAVIHYHGSCCTHDQPAMFHGVVFLWVLGLGLEVCPSVMYEVAHVSTG